MNDMPVSNRFAKLLSSHSVAKSDQIEPYLFKAQEVQSSDNITACLYFNDAWISLLPDFIERWGGPVSAIYEASDAKAISRSSLVDRLEALRSDHPEIRRWVDFHAVYNPHGSSIMANRTRERLISRPVASNHQLNLARFFARTDLVWLAADARILPSLRLRMYLASDAHLRETLVDEAHAVVVPTFAATSAVGAADSNHIMQIIQDMGASPGDGVDETTFEPVAERYVAGHIARMPGEHSSWPTSFRQLIGQSSELDVSTEGSIESEKVSTWRLYDRHWDADRGPTDLARLARPRASSIGDEEPDTGREIVTMYEVDQYEQHYSPSIVVGRDRQPWCNERFDYIRAACTHQMYLQGAKLLVLRGHWAFTLEPPTLSGSPHRNEAEKLKVSTACVRGCSSMDASSSNTR